MANVAESRPDSRTFRQSGAPETSTGEIVSAVASMSDFGNDASTNKQAMAMVGIRHKF
ncbi:MAG TPA: hypothetical protein VGL08_10145 [Paraburkholderia sp.]